jgi:hypothetical protein
LESDKHNTFAPNPASYSICKYRMTGKTWCPSCVILRTLSKCQKCNVNNMFTLQGNRDVGENVYTADCWNHSPLDLVSIFRCPSSPRNPVYSRRVELKSVYGLFVVGGWGDRPVTGETKNQDPVPYLRYVFRDLCWCKKVRIFCTSSKLTWYTFLTFSNHFPKPPSLKTFFLLKQKKVWN